MRTTRARLRWMRGFWPPRRRWSIRDHPIRHLRTWAKQLGLTEAVELLGQTLEEESQTDEALTKLAETAVNAAADERGRGAPHPHG